MTSGAVRTAPERILVRAANWIGDVVMSLPALEALRARYPASEIVVLARPWVSEIYAHHPAANRHLVYDREGKHRGPSGFRQLLDELREANFDCAILFQNAFHAAWTAWRAHIPVRVGYARDGRGALLTTAIEPPRRAAYGHQAYDYLQLLFRAGLIGKPRFVDPTEDGRLTVSEVERVWAKRHLESLGLYGQRFFVGLSPGAAFGPAKRWPPERYADLADRLIEALHADVLIFGSAAEKPLAVAIAKEMEHTPTIVAGETTLGQLLALLSQCRLVVSNDSGSMHLAAALGVPLVAVFGSTDERATGPLSPEARVVKHPVPCGPCGLRVCPIDFRCMTEVRVEDVYRAVWDLMGQQRASRERRA